MDVKNSIGKFELKKMWQWLLYIYVVLPLVLLAVAYFAREMSLGVTFARLFHSYNLYVINPIPHVPSLTGIVGAVIALGAIFRTLWLKDMPDFVISLILIAANAAYFLTETNYILVPLLSFS